MLKLWQMEFPFYMLDLELVDMTCLRELAKVAFHVIVGESVWLSMSLGVDEVLWFGDGINRDVFVITDKNDHEVDEVEEKEVFFLLLASRVSWDDAP